MVTAATPPALPGFEFIEPIGEGGFADVYLYQQKLPTRRVAVKVLRNTADEAGLAQFHAEANVMAQLSGHPSIVPIYQADVSDSGHAYLVMEFCPPPHLAQRYRVERLAVAEVLEIGIKIASAVETAHRVGILHRDVKPHNILTSAFGAPLLTDFGIASVAGEAGAGNYGMSIPWSPPESFADDPPADVRGDVFSLAATVYSLLAGRSPSEVPGAANDNATLIHRIERQVPSRITRADVPDALNDVLARSLSKRLVDRHPSAMAFARALQDVQEQMGLATTRLEVMDASPEAAAAPPDVEDQRTRVRPVAVIVPDEIRDMGTRLRPQLIAPADDKTSMRPVRREPAPDTMHRGPAVAVGPTSGAQILTAPDHQVDTAESSPRHLGLAAAIASALVVVVAAVVGVALIAGGPDSPTSTLPNSAEQPNSDPGVVIGSGPVTPGDLLGTPSDSGVTFTWTYGAEAADTFVVQSGRSLNSLAETQTSGTSFMVKTPPGGQACISVRARRGDSISDPVQNCVVRPS